MNTLLAAIILFILPALVKKLARYIEHALKRNKPNDEEAIEERIADNPVFAEKRNYLRSFLHVQELLLSLRKDRPDFHTDREKLRYFHFVMGAIDQLGQTIQDNTLSELWWISEPMGHAIALWGVDDAVTIMESYGCSGDPDLDQASTRGGAAMHTSILRSIDEVSESDFKTSCGELFSVVRGV